MSRVLCFYFCDGLMYGMYLTPKLRLERQLIGVEGLKTPAGDSGQVRPRRSVSDEEAPARGKRNAWNGNQQPYFVAKEE